MGRHWNEADAYIIAVENTAPYGVSVFKFDQDALYAGWLLCNRGVELWKEFQLDEQLEEGVLAYGDEINTLYLPSWAKKNMEEV